MKIKLLPLIILLLALIFVGIFCVNINNPKADNININIKTGTIQATGITLVVEDKNFIKSNISISDSYAIYRKNNDSTWELIYFYITPFEIYRTKINYPETVVLNWEKYIGALKLGIYKIQYEPISQQFKEIIFEI